MEVALNGRQIDLRKALPLVIRDWKALELQGLTTARLREPTISDAAAIAFYVLHKADPSVTQDEVDDLPLNDPAVLAVFRALNVAQEGPDVPFSTASTLQVRRTAGASET